MNDMAKSIPRINATPEDRKLEHQSTMIKLEGILGN